MTDFMNEDLALVLGTDRAYVFRKNVMALLLAVPAERSRLVGTLGSWVALLLTVTALAAEHPRVGAIGLAVSIMKISNVHH